MGKVVLNIKKPKGNDARTTAHIERTVMPGNADPARSHLNKELITFPEGVSGRTQAIQHRIETAGIKRKIGKNQIRALQVLLSGSPEDMKRIQTEGKLDQWCKDSVEWVQDEFGKDNVVSAVLHMDETTPHIHATVVPIVQGERRKAKEEQDNGKKKYRKKAKDTLRLCADDVMTRTNLERFQDTYAEKMSKYGLERGIRGSDARHVSTIEFYKDIYQKNIDLQENVESLEYRIEDAHKKVYDMYEHRDRAKDEFLSIDEQIRLKERDKALLESKLEQLKQDYEPYKAQDELNRIHELLPIVKEQLRIADLCKAIGLGIEYIKVLFEGRSLIAKSYSFFSPEHNRKFKAVDVKLKVEKEPDNPDKLRLNLNEQNILDWFKQKYQETKQIIRPNIQKKGGMRM
ncbi:hypothetical protein M2451_001531 [Dysgonomonas sp. PFB1-18]|uniref:MobV family relaxase n=1 Tax=unclassified Dysgonomonas TaxID=2630389 RepID=UPI0024740194|nr:MULTISPECIES: MobV family relaxase [unclassified Dysgonomonas]MDH6309011.1 hypothetical protein [Dysgonomonas sp. PF1-14]MDH6338762.1 hypothetical protein [Dysgonomonas sp. PF1-16]MDH6380210.1 hypothetical protein [Dysgonomonas sp. PFB1-18]MDH6397540.1 hypothetical protein [Dysgonomonas sp. PF1-23]